jgi:hypothetical protein
LGFFSLGDLALLDVVRLSTRRLLVPFRFLPRLACLTKKPYVAYEV